ncbi:MAG: hypothetical protein AVDCRST_MAG93-4842 [uncultured Chloroflexia bacterium]|uniref:Uncharacterized protein n=1 Tax=uncultured Chloroflexia bacterium TaxID=1672391 RepID=A0A6J4KHE4_9CHLR|nr:MAG: hypothetical protein AVDCRST_MAG93-4842 [uncultured Chloroflexia bacterium]
MTGVKTKMQKRRFPTTDEQLFRPKKKRPATVTNLNSSRIGSDKKPALQCDAWANALQGAGWQYKRTYPARARIWCRDITDPWSPWYSEEAAYNALQRGTQTP